MHPTFRVTPSDIQALDDIQARELVARLCQEDLLKQGLGVGHVTWGGDQRASDGGVDVRVECATYVSSDRGFVPGPFTIFQVKAEKFGSSKVRKEMCPRNIIRDSILDLSRYSGHYVLVSSKDSLSDSALKDRRSAMSESLCQFGIGGLVSYDFIDSRRLADLASSHITIVAWVKYVVGNEAFGWRPYGPWAYNDHYVNSDYLIDDKVRVYHSNSLEGLSCLDAIGEMRSILANERSAIRVVGLSGVGKTRLIQALFDKRIETEAPCPSEMSVIYTDLSDSVKPSPVDMVSSLASDQSPSFIILDNCGPELHSRALKAVKTPGSRSRLITIEYDIQDDDSIDTECIRLEGASDDIVSTLLRRQYKGLSELDITKIAEYSQGNVRVAFALASTAKKGGEFARLRDKDLFERLFNQRSAADIILTRCAQVASMLYSFNAKHIGEGSELKLMASLAETSELSFIKNIDELRRRGLVQARGEWRAVLPQAIANRLAEYAISAIPHEYLVSQLLLHSSERVAKSFTRRLGYLHDSIEAKSIASLITHSDSNLWDKQSFDSVKLSIIENLAPINQDEVLSGLCRIVKETGLAGDYSSYRSRIVSLLRSLAYEERLFHGAAMAIMSIISSDDPDQNDSSALNVLRSLFFIKLSGTSASSDQRSRFVYEISASGNTRSRLIAIKLLDAALEAMYFTSHYSFHFGALKRDYGWVPKESSDLREWYGSFLTIAVEMSSIHGIVGATAREMLARKLRGLSTCAELTDLVCNAVHDVVSKTYWPESWVHVRNTIHLDQKHLSDDSLAMLLRLEHEISPKTLSDEVKARIFTKGGTCSLFDNKYLLTPPGYSYEQQTFEMEQAENLGMAIANEPEVLADIPSFVSVANGTIRSFPFGRGIGRTTKHPRLLLESLRNSAPIQDLSFVLGIFAGWNISRPLEAIDFLNSAIEDIFWGEYLPQLQSLLPIDPPAVKRLLKCINTRPASRSQLRSISGSIVKSISVSGLRNIIQSLANTDSEGLYSSIDMLHLAIYNLPSRPDCGKSEMQDLAASFINDLDWRNLNLGDLDISYALSNVIDFALSDTRHIGIAEKSLTTILDIELISSYPDQLGGLIEPFFKHRTSESLSAIFLAKDVDLQRILSRTVGGATGSVIICAPEDEVIAWLMTSPIDRGPFIAHHCRLFKIAQPSDPAYNENLNPSTTVLTLLQIKECIQEIFDAISYRVIDGPWSGERSTFIRKRISFLDLLNPHGDEILSRLIANRKFDFSNHADMEEKNERLWSSSHLQSFE